MTSDEIWFLIYDKGLKGGTDTFSRTQLHLFYYIHFITHCDMEGTDGFLYNNSPTKIDDNEYKPFIESWRFFNYSDLADTVEVYNKTLSNAIAQLGDDKNMSHQKFLNRFGLEEIHKTVEDLVNQVYNRQDDIWRWIEMNKSTLIN